MHSSVCSTSLVQTFELFPNAVDPSVYVCCSLFSPCVWSWGCACQGVAFFLRQVNKVYLWLCI